MRIAVLGGTRFIGAAITEELVGAGHDVTVVHRGRTEAEGLPDVPHVHADRRDADAIAEALHGVEAVVDTCAFDRTDAETLLAAVGDARAVVLSSMDAYRAFGAVLARTVTDPVPLDERSPVRPERYPFRGDEHLNVDLDTDTYDKLDVEDLVLPAGATVLRLPMVYGERDPQRREEFVLRRIRAGRPRIPVGAGTWLWTKGWVRDVARAVRLAVEHDDLAGVLLNVGERRTSSMRHWMEAIVAASGADAELVRVPDEALPEDLNLTASQSQHLLVDSARARALLGWVDTDPDEALRASVTWHLAHPSADPDPDFTADDRALASGDREAERAHRESAVEDLEE